MIALIYHGCMQIRHIEYLLALEKERHFARAAAACNDAQPHRSARLAGLEEQLGTRLVKRDRRYIGLTSEGLAAIPWARQMVAAHAGMAAAAGAAKGPLRGTLRLGAIPASMPSVGFFARALQTAHAAVELDVRSLTSREIEQELAAFRLDAGLTYLDHEAPAKVEAVPLYVERPMLVVADDHPWSAKPSIRFDQALETPLCLLHRGMQNRRILDERLASEELSARPGATADSYPALLAMVGSGAFATIIPDSYRSLLPNWARVIPWIEEPYFSRIGLIVPMREPQPLLALAAKVVAERVQLSSDFGAL